MSSRELPNDRSFGAAAENYIRMGGERRYLSRIIEHFGERHVADITPADVKDMALALYPRHLGSTRNRHAITPARAVLYHAHEMGWRGTVRIRSFKTQRSGRHKPVNGEWLSKFINQADRDLLFHLSALVMFMNHTAARVSEAVELTGEHVDLRRRMATLIRTKTDRLVTAYLTDELVYRFYNMKLEAGVPVFGYSSRYGVNERIRAVCRRADIPYRSSHSVGRYSFATNAISLGVGIKAAMDAGRWRSSAVFLETYVHSENAGRLVADRFNSQRYASL